MARILPVLASQVTIFVLILSLSTILVIGEKKSHFWFYWHGEDPTSVQVVGPPQSTSTSFDVINLIENPLTLDPQVSSKVVGKAQGFYASAPQQNASLLMVMNFAFTDGEYKGSTITVLGTDPEFNTIREMPVLGGTGVFRFSRGYAQASTHTVDPKTGNAIVEYNVYVQQD
ncbi:dirigent protein 22-like [Fagus crenata]